MLNSSGLSGAAPIWSQFMEFAVPYLTNGAPSSFNRPSGIVDKIVCRLSGTEPSSFCKSEYNEVFASDQPPLPPSQDLVRRIKLDLWTGFQASEACKGPSEEATVMNVTDKWAREWFKSNQGRGWLEDNDLPEEPIYAPERECRADDPQPEIEFNLADGQLITAPVLEIKGTANADIGFRKWFLEYGVGDNPVTWVLLAESNSPIKNNTLHIWNIQNVPNGIVTLHLVLIGEHAEVEKRIRLNLVLPTATPAPATPTETPSPTPTATEFIIPSNTPSPTETETPTPTP
jgi:hypothetical protein